MKYSFYSLLEKYKYVVCVRNSILLVFENKWFIYVLWHLGLCVLTSKILGTFIHPCLFDDTLIMLSLVFLWNLSVLVQTVLSLFLFNKLLAHSFQPSLVFLLGTLVKFFFTVVQQPIYENWYVDLLTIKKLRT